MADVEGNKKLIPIVTELFPRGIKINLSLVYISQSYFKVPKTKVNTLFYYQNTYKNRTSTNSIKSLVLYKDFIKLYKDDTIR